VNWAIFSSYSVGLIPYLSRLESTVSMENLDAARHEGRERLYPSLTNPNWLVLRRRREIFRKWLARVDGRELDVLDVGGRHQPYRPLLEGRLRRYVSVDLRWMPLVNIVARGEQIPVTSEQFDLVICTQVLEYIPEPAAVIAEIYRVLKPGGCLLLSVPAVFPRDSDQDRWRFLPESLRYLLRSFHGAEVVAEGSSVAGFFRTVCICLVMFAKPSFIGKMLRFTLVPLLNITAVSLEWIFASSNDQLAANFSAFAKK
jgi:SAM-dependent methyltransferase